MKKWQNENSTDRIIRVIVGVILLLVAYNLTGAWSIIMYVISLIVFITAVTGFCALYKLSGISTLKDSVAPTAPTPPTSPTTPENH